MNDNALIASLSADLRPINRHAVERQIFAAGLIGGTTSLAALLATLGIQPGLDNASSLIPLLIKTGFGVSLATVGIAATLTLARPDGLTNGVLQKTAAIVSLMACIALVQGGYTHDIGESRLLLGASWQSCSLRIAALSLPITAAIGWAMRHQAPVRLRQAGAAVGLAAGAISASLYALACTETSSAFVLVWYSAGIALSTAIGALAGPRFLRW
jgi:hypothetical protein